MNDTRFTVDHVRRTTDKPFEEVTTAFERQLGRFDPDVYQALAAGGDAEGARAKIEAMAGPSGFMLFGTQDHGATAAPGRPEAEGGPVRRRQPAVRPPDDAARHPGEPVRPAAGADLRGRSREDLRGVRQAVLAVRPVRQRPHRPHRRHARPEAGGPGVGVPGMSQEDASGQTDLQSSGGTENRRLDLLRDIGSPMSSEVDPIV